MDSARRQGEAHHHRLNPEDVAQKADGRDRPARADEGGPGAEPALIRGSRGGHRRVFAGQEHGWDSGRASKRRSGAWWEQPGDPRANELLDLGWALVGDEPEL